jgi:hypothetical protein
VLAVRRTHGVPHVLHGIEDSPATQSIFKSRYQGYINSNNLHKKKKLTTLTMANRYRTKTQYHAYTILMLPEVHTLLRLLSIHMLRRKIEQASVFLNPKNINNGRKMPILKLFRERNIMLLPICLQSTLHNILI